MELVVLGCWAPYPRAGGACSGYLLRAGGLNVLLDSGNGTLSRMMSFIDFRSLDAVIISHLHHDHYLDLFSLRHAVEGARRAGTLAGPLRLFIPPVPETDFETLAGYKKAFETTPIESLPAEKVAGGFTARRLDLKRLVFRFVPARHALPGYSVSVEGDGKLVYSGDTVRTEELVALASGAGLFLCEASGLNSDAEYLKDNHLTAGQAGELAREAGVRRLLLTHFWPEYDPAVLVGQAAAAFGGRVEAAVEGNMYRLDG
ncbi:MAG: MBL fold metallo-hydrolase [Pelotomaculum sp.]|uniref:Metal-dependent hydrolases n=1 Tax=Pelotomaculum thermopropionicum (strain DSM 13744 / JCM 10971 / SI) TaxID=370438 RepID=A5D465_PELTS|nr:MBL fold metallo-hydrolase [Pelotomaculum sp.]BAF58971.1 metal-dependent hydrolases [Pelotomaculum thermopropionicum SI]